MYKQVKEPAFFGRKQRIVTVMFCDGCGARIRYSSSPEFGKHYCEKCFKKQKEKK